ncbi:Uu.00g134160.m01.CDS01 [Anthostomella pinea]|uniref:Uu.00g134160.m01.CDS01 n=1 Tax=Anthostomella pinea TaxID=933095 RepID=A0AAI8VNX1_9PEZI|nr:Uu.00g134160.m01.CDS01 [Anthostomella pinea]
MSVGGGVSLISFLGTDGAAQPSTISSSIACATSNTRGVLRTTTTTPTAALKPSLKTASRRPTTQMDRDPGFPPSRLPHSPTGALSSITASSFALSPAYGSSASLHQPPKTSGHLWSPVTTTIDRHPKRSPAASTTPLPTLGKRVESVGTLAQQRLGHNDVATWCG